MLGPRGLCIVSFPTCVLVFCSCPKYNRVQTMSGLAMKGGKWSEWWRVDKQVKKKEAEKNGKRKRWSVT